MSKMLKPNRVWTRNKYAKSIKRKYVFLHRATNLVPAALWRNRCSRNIFVSVSFFSNKEAVFWGCSSEFITYHRSFRSFRISCLAHLFSVNPLDLDKIDRLAISCKL